MRPIAGIRWAGPPAISATAGIEPDLSGPAAAEIVRASTAAELDAGGGAAVRCAGIIRDLICRRALGAVRLHVELGLASYLWRWPEMRAPQSSRGDPRTTLQSVAVIVPTGIAACSTMVLVSSVPRPPATRRAVPCGCRNAR